MAVIGAIGRMGGASNAYWKFSGPIIRNENQCAATSITWQLGGPITMIGGADTRTYFLTLNPAPDLLEYTQAFNIVEAPRELHHYTKAYL